MKTPINNEHEDFMPKGPEAESILTQRAMLLSRPLEDKKSISNELAYVCFRLDGNQYYGIGYQYIAEVKEVGSLTKIPLVPDFIAGVINWRGRLISVIDLKKLFHLEYEPNPLNQHSIIVLAHQSLTVGVLIDDIVGDEVYTLENLAPPLVVPGAMKAEYVVGLHKGINAILSVENILADITEYLTKNT